MTLTVLEKKANWSMKLLPSTIVITIPNNIKVSDIYNISPLNLGSTRKIQRNERMLKETEIIGVENGILTK